LTVFDSRQLTALYLRMLTIYFRSDSGLIDYGKTVGRLP
jgi:hypothetical protein